MGVATLVFLIIHFIPGDPVDLMLGETAKPLDKEKLREELGLNKPVLQQYYLFLWRLSKGDLGRSLHSNRPVGALILRRYPATLKLTLASMFVALVISLPSGIISAIRKYTVWDHGFRLMALLGVSLPNFWLGPLLIILFSLKLDWLPVSGAEGFASLILPSVTLGTGMAAILTRMTRASLLETINEAYIITARAKGLGEFVVVVKHALSNALIPIITVLGLQFGALLSGAIITETIFAWPGLGRLMIQAINQRDYPLVQGAVLVIALSYVLINLLTDIVYSLIDPRIRLE